MGDAIRTGSDSKLFEPLKIGNGKIELKHRVILAPLTRNRGTPVNLNSTAESPNRVWVSNDLMAEYYTQRATEGGLLISEGIPPSLEGNAMPGVPGIFTKDQAEDWRKMVDAVHAKGGYIYAQIWHSSRANIPHIVIPLDHKNILDYRLILTPHLTGTPIVAPSSIPWDDPNETFVYPAPHSTTPIKIAEHPPIELTQEHITKTIQDFCDAAKAAITDAGFDGVELHGANGYLVEQFLSSNSNKRTDKYGGSPEKHCTFALELMEALAKTVGQENLAIRLTPFGLFNQARSEQRVETWTHLCHELKQRLPCLSYVSFIEPRYEQIFSESEKQKFLNSWSLPNVDLSAFRKIFGDTPFFSAGGFDDKKSWEVVESGKYDALVYGRYFISNPDLPERLRKGLPLAHMTAHASMVRSRTQPLDTPTTLNTTTNTLNYTERSFCQFNEPFSLKMTVQETSPVHSGTGREARSSPPEEPGAASNTRCKAPSPPFSIFDNMILGIFC